MLMLNGSQITPPFAPPKVDDRALPGHPRGERLHLIDRHVLVEANAALGGAA
jgi:hypothetical protein